MSLRLEVGKTYEMRGGGLRNVIAYVPVNPITGFQNSRPFAAASEIWDLSWHTEAGELHGRDDIDDNDLVREHVPPPTLKEVCKEVAELQAGTITVVRFNAIVEKAKSALAAEKAKVGQ